MVTFIGNPLFRTPYPFTVAGVGENGTVDIVSDTNVSAGDLCLIWASSNTWNDDTIIAPSSAVQLQFHPDSVGASCSLYSYVPISTGAFTATHKSRWSTTIYQAILPFYTPAPVIPRPANQRFILVT